MNGGITFLSESTIQIKYSHFHNNSAVERDGAILAFRMSTVMVSDSSFIGNKAEQSGGALYLEFYVKVKIMNTLFLSNAATTFYNTNNVKIIPEYEAGAISCKIGCFLTCVDCNFAGLIEKAKLVYSKKNITIGGAVSVSDKSTLYVVNVKFISNKVTNYGGAIVAADFSTIVVSNSSFENNEASDTSQLNISETVMTSKHVPYSGGCFFIIYESSAVVSNCLFERNSAELFLAGAIHVSTTGRARLIRTRLIRSST